MNEKIIKMLIDYSKKYGVLGFLIAILLWVPAVYFKGPFQEGIGDITRAIVKEELAPVKQNMELLTDFMFGEKVKNISKQASKIQKDPDDIKMADIRAAISDWPLIPEKYKNAVLIQQFDVISVWSQNHLGDLF